MPELPEVETVKRGIEPYCLGKKVQSVHIYHPRLRWPIPPFLPEILKNKEIKGLWRRGKYLIFQFEHGALLLHLGMSGILRVLTANHPLQKHDHFELRMDECYLRLNDTRRFGAVLWTDKAVEIHPLIVDLGPEPLLEAFNADYLFQKTRKRLTPIKTYLMNAKVVVGVGNIYANEALFDARIHPLTPAGHISFSQCEQLVQAVKTILTQAILSGGSTIRSFANSEGKPGYFAQTLRVYGRKDQPCKQCKTPLKEIRLQGRSTVFCITCQAEV